MSEKIDPTGTTRDPIDRDPCATTGSSEPSSGNDASRPSAAPATKGILRPRGRDGVRECGGPARAGRKAATRSNDIWAVRFVNATLATGRSVPRMTVVDEFSMVALAARRLDGHGGLEVVLVLEGVRKRRGHPASLRIGDGTEWTHEPQAWAARKGIDLVISAGGDPIRQAFSERKPTARPGRSS